MIVTRTPFRVSFVGGGSDLPEFYTKHQGAVLSCTINKYMYISTHRFFDEDKICLKYSKTEITSNVHELQHPAAREILKKFSIHGALEISSNADVPAGTGLGSSSSFAVGLLHNLYAFSGRFAPKEELAQNACEIEIEKLKEPIGKQDQYAAAYGGLNIIKFHKSGSVDVEPLYLNQEVYERLQRNLLMFYVGDQRNTALILSEQQQNMVYEDKVSILNKMVDLVWYMRDALYNGRVDDLGPILHANWELKKQLASKITNAKIDEYYDIAINNGALGGKILGAGGGGFLLFYCPEEKQILLRKALFFLKEMPFRIEREGSKVIYVGDVYGR